MLGFLKRYKVDYSGGKLCWKNARDSYRAGQTVVLYYHMIATDTNYRFFVDGAPVQPGFEEGRGFVIKFKMPPHGVRIVCEEKNTMLPDR